MDIELKEARSITLPSGAKQTFPAGWTGDAPTADAARWIKEGVARRVVPANPVGQLTPRQTAILAQAADEIDAVQRQAAEQHETTPAPAPTSSFPGEGEEIDLEACTDEQLHEIARNLGVSIGRRKRASLIAAIAAKAAEINAAAEAGS